MTRLAALAWKEWRLQRWIFLGLALAPGLMLLAAGKVIGGVGLALIFYGGGVLILSANSFCSEEDDATAWFMAKLPSGRTRLYLVKAAMTATLSLVAGLPLAAAGMLAIRFGIDLRDFGPYGLTETDEVVFVEMPLAVAVLSWLPAITAALTRRTIACLLSSVVLAGGMCAWAGFFFRLPLRALVWGDHPARWMVWFPATVFFLCGVVWVHVGGRAEMRACTRSLYSFLALIAMPLLMASPLIAQWTKVTFFTSPEAFLYHHYGASDYQYKVSASPAGRHLMLTVRHPIWGHSYKGSRAIVIDTQSGKARWLSRWIRSSEDEYFSPQMASGWSPDGDRLLFEKGGQYSFHDTQSGETLDLSEICVGFPAQQGERFMGTTADGKFVFRYALSTNAGGAAFLDARAGAVHRCRVSEFYPSAFVVNGRGVFGLSVLEAENQESKLLICRYSADMDVAESRSLPLRKQEWTSPWSWACSPDGEWLLFGIYDRSSAHQSTLRRTSLLRFSTGEATVLASRDPSDTPVITGNVSSAQFLPNSHTVLLSTDSGVMTYNADTKAITPLPLGIEIGPGDARYQLAPFPVGVPGRNMLSVDGRFALVRVPLAISPGRNFPEQFREQVVSVGSVWETPAVVEVSTGRTWIIPTTANPQWFGPDRLIVPVDGRVWSVRYDGTDKKLILGKKE